jgi:hypothetical protein
VSEPRALAAVAAALVLVLAACTEENEVYNPPGGDAAAADDGQATSDGQVGADSLPGDAKAKGDGKATSKGDGPSGDGYTCSPDAFIACKTSSILLKCNTAGTGTVTVDCSPYLCSATEKRCNQCDPNSPPTCSGSTLITCTSNGLLVETSCPSGCKNGACLTCTPQTFYMDADGDSYGNPGAPVSSCTKPTGYVTDKQDCDDLDASAHPGQKVYFTQPTKGVGNFDYNCNKLEELQDSALASCVWKGNSCVGDGWSGTVPACGKPGQFVNCTKKQGRTTGCTEVATKKIQACR